LNMAHIHARGHGRMKTSEDYAELFDQVRETYGGKTFYCHFAGVEHRMGNAQHYTQIKKSDLKFEPFAEYLAEEGDWMDITIISDSPLLEHDAMYMVQHYDKARQRLLEIRARDDRRMKLAAEAGIDVEELARREKEQAEARKQALLTDKEKRAAAKAAREAKAAEAAEAAKKAKAEAAKKPKTVLVPKKAKKAKKDDGKMMSIEGGDDDKDFEDLF